MKTNVIHLYIICWDIQIINYQKHRTLQQHIKKKTHKAKQIKNIALNQSPNWFLGIYLPKD